MKDDGMNEKPETQGDSCTSVGDGLSKPAFDLAMPVQGFPQYIVFIPRERHSHRLNRNTNIVCSQCIAEDLFGFENTSRIVVLFLSL
jgi:hypothetical protein